MKLAKIAISVAVVLGAVATGGSWYTGKQVEQRYAELVQQANESLTMLKLYGAEAQLKDVKVERGLFSSDFSYNLEVKIAEERYQFNGNDKLYHGPFPVNRVMKGNILPAMASAETQIAVPENLKTFFVKPTLLQGTTDISYAEAFSGELTLNGLKEGELPFTFSDSNFEYNLDKKGEGKIKFKLPLLKIEQQELGQNIVVEQAEYEMELKAKSEYQFISLGDFEGKMKAYRFTESDPTVDFFNVAFTDIKMKGDGKIENGIYKSTGDVTGNLVLSTKEGEQNLGQLKLDMFIALNAKEYDHAMSYISSPELLQSEEAQTAMQTLFSKGVQFHLKELALANSKGKNELSLIVNSQPFEWGKVQSLEEALQLFSQSKFEGKFSQSALEETAKQFFAIDPEMKAQAEERAKDFIQQLVAQAQESGVVEVDNEKLKFQLEVDNGKVKLNNREVPERELQGMLFMLMLALGSMGQ